MKNKIIFISTLVLVIFFNISKTLSAEQFNFDVTEIEILNDGNLIKGLKRGTITINNEIIINSDKFEYDKISNILFTEGNVVIEDTQKKQFIFGDEITYFREQNKFFGKNNVEIKDLVKNQIITADEATYFRNLEKFNLKNNVKIKDNFKDQTIISEEITYLKNIGKINSRGETEAFIKKKYHIISSDVLYLMDQNKISSNEKTIIKHKETNIYNLNKFSFLTEEEILNGESVLIINNFGLPKSDKIYLSSGIFDFKNQNFIGKKPEVKVHKSVFDDPDNDPRIKGVSSTGNENKIKIKKGVFTSCNKDSDCPPWSISSEEIIHDRQKKEIHYKNAILRIYDFPILYFPKFFHPDPTVVRRSGFLKPKFRDSLALGSSITTPYFKEMSDNKDVTLAPTLFDSNMQMIQNEYRQINEFSKFIAHLGFTNNYKSSSQDKKKNSIFHFFSDFELDLNLDNFITSDLFAKIERVTNDTYLKVFESNLSESIAIPESQNTLKNELKISLDHENFDFESGIKIFEDLHKKSSDRYEYILPYYSFNKILSDDFYDGSLNFSSNGTNQLINTNDLKTNMNNNLNYNSNKYISNNGLVNNFKIDIKNLNSIGKNNSQYKSSPQVELVSIYDFNTSIPLIKINENFNNFLTPKLSLKFNPSDMKNYSDLDTQINNDNVFSNNRIGVSDTFETGRSLTLGVDYKKENINDINKFFELKLATVFRDKEEQDIPKKSTLNRKSSNLFGSISHKFFENVDFKYNFALDNNYKNFEYNNISANISFKNFETTIKFIEENGEMGDNNILENEIYYNFDESNSFSFQTRRNRKLNLTEYYDLVYEYKNDCLTAGIKFKKTFYEDRDLLPNEDLFFTITLIPITTHEQDASRLIDGTLGF